MKYSEIKMDFDYSVGTEDRFALRKWFEEFVRLQNEGSFEDIINYFDEQFSVDGLSSEKIGYSDTVEFVQLFVAGQPRPVMAYPDVKVKFQRVLFAFQGSFEGFLDRILSYDGTFEARIVKHDNSFKVVYLKCYPRLMVNKS